MKPIKPRLILALIAAFLMLSAPAWGQSGNGHGHGDKEHHKQGILLVTFGTSNPDARAAFDNIDKIVNKAYPDTPVHWAYTSRMIRQKLAQEDEHLKSPAQALAMMQDQGFTHVAVQSLHIIPGSEFHDLQSMVQGFRDMNGGFKKITLGSPLLSHPESLERVKEAMLENIPPERDNDEAVLFLGHGSHHPGNAFYPAMAYIFQQADPLAYVTTVHKAAPRLEPVMAELQQKDVDTVYLLPFMSVAGDHARKDMAGSGEDSLKSVLEAEGFAVKTVMKGMAEYDNVAGVWLGHLDRAMARLENE
ncbi:MAG: sirohydrochlorin cobaltochelatase [Desulfohalobiaceae bacterium]|nr:sirohydrochlorin cobaltochelatase [Desulfohalobiaceae bacterium]MCF8086258.1 sirohydrochlorin cobaltochelatase [Desulfohalobiaceae bacterium]